MDSPLTLLSAEGLVATHAVAARYSVHAATIRRWCLYGGTARDGSRVRLQHVRTPGRMRTSFAAVERFLSQLAETPEVTAPPTTRTTAKRNHADERAAKALAEMGI